jgi:hypothetical protein
MIFATFSAFQPSYINDDTPPEYVGDYPPEEENAVSRSKRSTSPYKCHVEQVIYERIIFTKQSKKVLIWVGYLKKNNRATKSNVNVMLNSHDLNEQQ